MDTVVSFCDRDVGQRNHRPACGDYFQLLVVPCALFESYGAFTPLRPAAAAVKFETVRWFDMTAKSEIEF